MDTLSDDAAGGERRTERRRELLCLASIGAVLTLFFADVLFFGLSPVEGDLVAYHFPMKKVMRELVFSGSFPYWNPLIEAGQPVAANPAWELFYPLQWLVLVPDFLLGFKLHIVLHYYLAAAGMFLLTRSLGMARTTALTAAGAFALGGPLLSLAGILPFLFSMAWLPWIFLFATRYLRQGRLLDFGLAAGSLAMQMLVGEPVVLVETMVAAGVGAVVLRRVRAGILLVVAALAIAAVQIVPAMDHARDSVRSIPLDFPAVKKWSLTPARPLELLVPTRRISDASGSEISVHRFHGNGRPFLVSIYIGLPLALMAVAGMVLRIRFWKSCLGLVAVLTLIALGDQTPLLKILYEARLFSSIRYPEKFLLLPLFLLVLFGASALDELLRGSRRMRMAGVGAALAVFVAATVVALAHSPAVFNFTWRLDRPAIPAEILAADRSEWTLAALRALALALLFTRAHRRLVSFALAGLALADLAWISSSIPLRLPDDFYREPPPLLAQFPPAGSRVFHDLAMEHALGIRPTGEAYAGRWIRRNELFPFLPAVWGRETVLGFDYDETTLLPSRRLRVAAEVAKTERPELWPRAFMAMSNATARVVARDARVAAAEAGGDLSRFTPAQVVRDLEQAPRFRFASRLVPCADTADCVRRMSGTGEVLVPPSLPARLVAPGSVLRARQTPNSVDLDVRAAGPGFLVVSITEHKYWRASVDGRAVPLIPANLAYMGVVVPAGEHRIRLEYENPLVAAGGAVSLAAVLALVLLAVRDAKRRHALSGGAE